MMPVRCLKLLLDSYVTNRPQVHREVLHGNRTLSKVFPATMRSNKISSGWYVYQFSRLKFTATHSNFQSLGSFFRPGDIFIGETGTSAFGLCNSRLPEGVMMFNQTVYGSIGYATGSTVGVGQAIKESGGKWKRPILVTGEGSMHLTVQAIADMLRWDLKPIMYDVIPLQTRYQF